jgi:hypothetical protein
MQGERVKGRKGRKHRLLSPGLRRTQTGEQFFMEKQGEKAMGRISETSCILQTQ